MKLERPLSVTLLALYLLVVFGLSLIGSVYVAIATVPPYDRDEWLILMLPKLAALGAGIAFWHMLRVGDWMLVLSIIGGWMLALLMRTGFSPRLSVSLLVSVIFALVSGWIIASNWGRLRPIRHVESVG